MRSRAHSVGLGRAQPRTRASRWAETLSPARRARSVMVTTYRSKKAAKKLVSVQLGRRSNKAFVLPQQVKRAH